ncbi:MAG: LicD family protein [Pseudomonadota bacterium]
MNQAKRPAGVQLIQMDCDDGICIANDREEDVLRFFTASGEVFAYFLLGSCAKPCVGAFRLEIVVPKNQFPRVSVDYDSSDESVRISSDHPGAFKKALLINTIDEGENVRASFVMPDAAFRNRINGADFRIGRTFISEEPLIVRSVLLLPQNERSNKNRSQVTIDYENSHNHVVDTNDAATLLAQRRLERMRDLLNTVTGILEDEGIDYWLDRGTLLAAYRSGFIIDYDDDIDLRVLHSDWPVIKRALEKNLPKTLKLVLHHHGEVVHQPDSSDPEYRFTDVEGNQQLVRSDGRRGEGKWHAVTAMCVVPVHLPWFAKPNLDLYCVGVNGHICCSDATYRPWNDDGENYLCLPAPREHQQAVLHDLVFPLTELKLEGRQRKVPKDSESYLRQMFGYIGENAVHNDETGYWEPVEK